ncbi:hypothetical protein OO014_14340 [Intrasporangium calvum]|uniref:Ferric siderophore reductase C-terminal domain-containing protein n=1 Tax=Intrasporangium calvum TaxID=53358 RepID=A0ABT5GJM0_9MICO|nr:hypothetical protein [Intrasporangium calvum]MDC5698435.1 hypothetical protein [Intrasporangium calvum]
MPQLAALVELVDRALPFVTLTMESSPATTWVADITAQTGAGQDPLATWRRALAARQGSEERPHVAAAFVLQWWCEVAATPLAYAAELASVVLLPSPAGLGFELAPGLHPARLVLHPGHVAVDEPADRSRKAALEASSAAYREVVSEVVRDYAPEVKMSSRQRWGVVDDVWRLAAARAAGAAAPRRRSCCFIVALPGMRPCATCPGQKVSRGW